MAISLSSSKPVKETVLKTLLILLREDNAVDEVCDDVLISDSSHFTISEILKYGVRVVAANLKLPQSHLDSFILDHPPIAVASYFSLSGGKKKPCTIGVTANQSAITPIPTVKPKVRGFQLYALLVSLSTEESAEGGIPLRYRCRLPFAVEIEAVYIP